MHCLSQHTSPEEKDKLKIKCEVPGCDYASIFKNKLKRHNITVHLKQRNHCCQHCAKTFSSLSAMKEHINGVHLNLKPLLCDICEFATACTLVDHFLMHIITTYLSFKPIIFRYINPPRTQNGSPWESKI